MPVSSSTTSTLTTGTIIQRSSRTRNTVNNNSPTTDTTPSTFAFQSFYIGRENSNTSITTPTPTATSTANHSRTTSTTNTISSHSSSQQGNYCPGCSGQLDFQTCHKSHCNKFLTKTSGNTYNGKSTLPSQSLLNESSTWHRSSNDNGRKWTRNRKICLLTNRTDDDRWVDLSDQRLTSGSLGHLYSGSEFIGIQKGATSNYDVAVEIQYVDLKNDVLGGYLHISGLTALYPEITTFFEGEIIGPKHSFLTRKWLADLSVDTKHWGRFASFAPYLDIFNKDDFHYDHLDQDFIYMRWKEKFLVPNHHLNSIDGASYAGFYYICYQRSTGNINGFYYCRSNIEWFQELTLSHALQRQFPSFEFR
ncbi:vacuolar import and degradation protein-domain-containing protein [Halteromyces radiatus]|uniref:vacuolar import and degradation protein-domain-containing protein n=1 Tax=Halteromyces radiatus TaxID=101107 RepID=UPI0022212175|nr:vacuolar import and degradation protein-domain-containing protein [Halteromyces radiatus]KAI8096699.1 vacuolar import and degradation protein-domain-containing protein [Halteromyces radiatus]